MTDRSSPRTLPSGTLTFLFSDIEGSTRLVQSLGDAYGPFLLRQQALMRAAFEAGGGVEVGTEGDSFFVVFPSAVAAARAAADAQRAMAAESWPSTVGRVKVRIGLHTGEGTLGGDNYVGLDVHRAARIAAAAHGGQVLVSDATRALVAGALGAEVRLRDLGEHRLKDLDQPERLFQLVVSGLPADFPPPRSLEAPTNLPPQVTSFIGRQKEAGEVAELVRRSRLVTLIGPGGTGKTRLSLEVASQLREEFPGGAFFVDLSPISDPDLIATTIAAALGVAEQPDTPVLESLKAHLREKTLLLVLDNFEQLQSAAPMVGQVLEAAPTLRVIVTTREVLHLRGEQEYPVPPLGLPDLAQLPALEALSQYDAVALFIQRAQSVRPDFAVDNANAPAVAGICSRLDGLPLAIELAAARVNVLAPDAILSRLEKSLSLLTSGSRDLSERQRTLRGAIDWSHDLLGGTERTLFARLGIFVGGWTIERAEAICDPDRALGIDMLDALASFVDKSLVRQSLGGDGEPRFGMLETIHEYALERLVTSDDGHQYRRAHEDHFAGLAAEARPHITGAEQKVWAARLDAERDNLRAALQRLADDGRIGDAMEMAWALWRYWLLRGNLAEGRATLEDLLARAGDAAAGVSRARALSALGGLAYWQSDMTTSMRAYEEGLALQRTLDDPAGLAEALYNLGFTLAVAERHAQARALSTEGLEIAKRIGDRTLTLGLREALAFEMFHTGEVDEAYRLLSENMRDYREAGERFRLAIATGFSSYLAAKSGDVATSRALQQEAFDIFREAGDKHWMVRAMMIGAISAVAIGDFDKAARLCGAYGLMAEPLGEMATPIKTLRLPDPEPQAREALGAAFEAAYAAGRAMTLDEVSALLG
jgi:predicted ATPase/class 3 adenylate cyclase